MTLPIFLAITAVFILAIAIYGTVDNWDSWAKEDTFTMLFLFYTACLLGIAAFTISPFKIIWGE